MTDTLLYMSNRFNNQFDKRFDEISSHYYLCIKIKKF